MDKSIEPMLLELVYPRFGEIALILEKKLNHIVY